MKSARESALINRSQARPNRIDLPREANAVLKKLEIAKAYGSKRKYDNELRKLAEQYPDMADEIFKLRMWD
jgi:hypothetical protein